MAVRWGAGEETLTTCNMDMFTLEALDETTGLRSEGTFSTLQGCLDPTILSMFEDTQSIETRDFEDETEATLLTALTEILDNVDDENLSPFDTLPESDLLSGQKGREHSPLRRLFCLSRSPQEKDITSKRRSTGKIQPMVQRSDGEEENSLSPRSGGLELSSHDELLDWEELPITLEQYEDDGHSVNLGNLIRQMHPYCMAISLEDDIGEQILPDEGIVLEVVDQGENGEPILVIPKMNHPISVKVDQPMSNSKALDEEDCASDSSEQIIVVDDDDDDDVKPPVKDEESNSAMMKNEISNSNLKGLKHENASNREKKLNTSCSPQPTVGRVLRSRSSKNTKQAKSEKDLLQPESEAPQNVNATSLLTKPKDITISQTERKGTTGASSTLLVKSSKLDESNKYENPPKKKCVQLSDATSNIVVAASEEGSVAELPVSKSLPSTFVDQAASSESTQTSQVTGEPSPLLTPAVTAEPKPKALSLAEYRRLRQQKKPAPINKQENSSTKWPSLPEMPKELPPIPYLPEPSPKDPRRSRPQVKENEDVKPAWMPRGPCAPPTPEALLAPPAYMVNSTVNKVSAATVSKPQFTVTQTVPSQHSNHQITSAVQETNKEDESCSTDSSQTCQTSASVANDVKKPVNVLMSMPSNAADSPETKNSTEYPAKSINTRGQLSSINLDKLPSQGTPDKSEKSTAKPLLPKSPTQELIEAFTSEMGIEATDLTSLLEQFEETQAKEEQCVPEVSGRAVAVGNSSYDLVSEKTDVERVRANDLSSTALTPPATPPHPMWKPLVPMSLLGKNKAAETKSKVIEIEAQPLPSIKARSKFTPACASVAPVMACQDHDYCLPNKGTSSEEAGKRWNVKQNTSITIKPIKQPTTPTVQNIQTNAVQSITCAAKKQQLDLKTDCLEKCSVLETPDASPTRDFDNSTCVKNSPFERRYRQRATSCTPSPERRSVGRSRLRRSPSPRSSSSESDSSRSRSRSSSPPKKRYRRRHSRNSSSSQSRSSSQSVSPPRSPRRRRRYSYSSSRSPSWSRSRSCSRSRSRSYSRSRSRSPQWSRKRLLCSTSNKDLYGGNVKTNHEIKKRKEKAIEERRVVYVGRIRGTMTQRELKERFSFFWRD